MLVSGVTQSNENFEVDDNFDLSLISIVRNRDNLCLPWSLVVGEAFLNIKEDATDAAKKEWTVIRNGRTKRPRINVNHRSQNSNSFGSGEAPFFDGRATIRDVQPSKIINISYDAREHYYDIILNLTGGAKRKIFCACCNKKCHYVDQHVCKSVCRACFVTPRCKKDNVQLIKCNDCFRNFLGITCFENHKTSGSYKKRNKKVCDLHECCISYCKIYRTKYWRNDACYMSALRAPKRLTENPKKYLYVIYDFKTQQDSLFKNRTDMRLHVPNLCVVQQMCTDCLTRSDLSERCETCGIREYVYREDPVRQFIELYIREKSAFHRII
ncbi:hypothetical protein TSAR_001988, partial [Trichomalopsis sarcophagae]